MTVKVAVPCAPIFAKPEYGLELDDEVFYGMPAEILDRSKNFYEIETFYLYRGYIRKTEVEICDAENTDDMTDYIIHRPCADIVDRPDIKGIVIETLFAGSIVRPLAVLENDFTEITMYIGTGFIRSSVLKPFKSRIKPDISDEEAFRKRLVATAEQFLSSPYRWGGKSVLGIDCSGLCSLAYLLNGVIIHRNSSQDPRFAIKPVSREDLRPGDLIYSPGHIMMYTGDGEYIHSSVSNDGVFKNSLDEASPIYNPKLAASVTGFGSMFG